MSDWAPDAPRLPERRHARVVYTAVFGDYDTVTGVDADCACDFICFTDNPALRANGWSKVVVNAVSEPPAISNRRYKMLAHRYLPGYSQSLYVDGNVIVRRCPCDLFDKYLQGFTIAMPTHQERNCAFDEAECCVKDGLVDKELAERQLAEYARLGFPRQYGMTENNVILRQHNDSKVVALMEAWWSEYQAKARRDQISLPFLLWQRRVAVGEIQEGPRRSGKYFRLKPHAQRKMSWPKKLAWYVTTNRHRNLPYRIAYQMYRLVSPLLTFR